LQNYHSAFRQLPPGSVMTDALRPVPVCSSSKMFAAANVNFEAGQGAGHQRTSWIVHLLPFIEQAALYESWDFQTSVAGNRTAAETDVPMLYCPSRRSTVTNPAIMFQGWLGGGNDYGGSVGGCNGWHNCGFHELWQTDYEDRTLGEHKGVFHAVNRGVRFSEVMDGLSNTVALGELQRLDKGLHVTTSRDGWAVGGVSSHFSTCSDGCYAPNSDHFEAPGSNHPGGVNLAFADGRVQFLTDSTSAAILKSIGGIADGSAEQPPQ
ncbi:MAG: DUF1559 domain-containing protein, partial [Planctomycetota bacterium]